MADLAEIERRLLEVERKLGLAPPAFERKILYMDGDYRKEARVVVSVEDERAARNLGYRGHRESFSEMPNADTKAPTARRIR